MELGFQMLFHPSTMPCMYLTEWKCSHSRNICARSISLCDMFSNKKTCFNNHIFDGLTVMISACHATKRGRPGFDSPSESK
jgi:hypothetical protein